MSDALAHASYPRRNLKQLYCQSITYLCAIGALPTCPPNKICGDGDEHEPDADAPSSPAATTTARANATGSLSCCVPCAYKICNFDIALDYEFTKCIPNQRPEQCPRSSVLSYTNIQPDGDTMGYHRGMNVLTVGDGDFSFSLAIARLVIGGIGPNNDCHTSDGGMVVATSYENFNTLRKVYPDFEKTLDSLMCHGGNNVIVAYNVDATQLEKTLPEHLWRHSRLLNQKDVKFHRICWNL
jgi:hypothetical protein